MKDHSLLEGVERLTEGDKSPVETLIEEHRGHWQELVLEVFNSD